MRSARVMLSLTLALLIASPLLAAERKKRGEKKPPKCPVEQKIEAMTKGLTLTDAQKTKLDDIKKEIAPKYAEAVKAQDVLTPEQKKAQDDAKKAAKAAGKKGKEAKKAIDDAVKITPEQKTKEADAKKQLSALEKDLRAKVQAVLTPEQQAQLKAKPKAKKEPGQKKKKAEKK